MGVDYTVSVSARGDSTSLPAALLNRRSPVAISCAVRFYLPRSATDGLRWRILRFTNLANLSTAERQPTDSDGPIFRRQRPPGAPSFVARRKIGEKGVPKGSKAALWNLCFYTGVRRGDVRRLYEFARVQLTRFRPVRGVLRTASTDSIVLLQLQANTLAL